LKFEWEGGGLEWKFEAVVVRPANMFVLLEALELIGCCCAGGKCRFILFMLSKEDKDEEDKVVAIDAVAVVAYNILISHEQFALTHDRIYI
jgi:hypothetical protein